MTAQAIPASDPGQVWLRLVQSPPLAGRIPFELRAFLSDWSQASGWRGCAWIPVHGQPVLARGVSPKELAPWRYAALKPGQHVLVSTSQAPRLDADWQECLVRHSDGRLPGSAGTLRFLIPSEESSNEGSNPLEQAEAPWRAQAGQFIQTFAAAKVWLEERVRTQQESGALELGLRMGGLMHDLRNRLTLLSMQQQRMAQDPHAAESLAGPHEQLMAEVRAMCAALVPEESGGTMPQRIELRPLLTRVAKQAPSLVRRRDGNAMSGIRLRCRSDLLVYADPILLSRTLENLLVNALEASRPEQVVSLSASGDERSVTLEVNDEGIGMDAPTLARAYQAGQGSEHGTGFGSVSLLGALDGLQGELHVDTAPGRGTRCRLVLQQPFDWDAALLVDPDSRRRRSLVARLNRHGVRVQAMKRASAAIRAMGDASPRAVYMVRGLQDPHVDDLVQLAETQACPIWILGSRGIVPWAETQHAPQSEA